MIYTPAEIATFLTGVKNGEFDDLYPFPGTTSRYYPLVTYGGLTKRQRGDIVLHVHPPFSSAVADGSTAVTGRPGDRELGVNHRLSE